MDYEWPGLDRFRELRRGLPVVAAVLFVLAPAVPMWRISVEAVQYPTTELYLDLYAYPRIDGTYVEMANLNKYVGFYYPDPVLIEPNYTPYPYAIDVPEWALGPLAFVGVALLSLFVALAPTAEKLKRGLTAQLDGTIAVFEIMLADIQYRLYQAGHHLDPDAPIMGVEGFTPPLWGTYEVANITSHSRFCLGAYLSMLAIGLLAVAYRCRDTRTTVGDLPELAAELPDRIRERRDRRGGAEATDPDRESPATKASERR